MKRSCALAILAVLVTAGSAGGRPSANGAIVVQGTVRGKTSIYVLTQAGALTKLPGAGRFTGEPTWSPDGLRIGFTSDRGSGGTGGDVFVMNASGGGVRQLTFNSFDEHDPAWAPSGGRIAFAGEQGVGVTADDGSIVTKITAEVPLRRPTWAPNGRRIAFSSGPNRKLPSSQIYVVNLNGTGLRKITAIVGGAGEPDWAPNGRLIVFDAGRPADLYVMHPDGSGLRRLTRTQVAERAPAWSPDARRIVFARDGAIWSMPAGGGRAVQVLSRPGIRFDRPDWQRVRG